MLRVPLMAAALIALPFVTFAETPKAALDRMVKMPGQKYACKVEKRSANGGWLADGYLLVLPEGGKTALVGDDVGMTVTGAPADAEIREDTAKKLVVTWDMRSRDAAGQLARMGYRLSYFKKTGQVTVRATPYGYSNSFEARGRCQTF